VALLFGLAAGVFFGVGMFVVRKLVPATKPDVVRTTAKFYAVLGVGIAIVGLIIALARS
jgi:hypothetical protein